MRHPIRTAEHVTDTDMLLEQLNGPQMRRDGWLDFGLDCLDMAYPFGRGMLWVIAAAAAGMMLYMSYDLATGLPGVIERAKAEAAQ